MTGVQVQELLRKSVLDAGGVQLWSATNKIAQSQVSRALSGHSAPPASILAALGVVKKIEYVVEG